MLVEEIWYDLQGAEVLAIVDPNFARLWMNVDDTTLEQVVMEWARDFLYGKPLQDSPLYNALVELRTVARDVIVNETSLVFHLAGVSLFLRVP